MSDDIIAQWDVSVKPSTLAGLLDLVHTPAAVSVVRVVAWAFLALPFLAAQAFGVNSFTVWLVAFGRRSKSSVKKEYSDTIEGVF
jgi:hypothetical protein